MTEDEWAAQRAVLEKERDDAVAAAERAGRAQSDFLAHMSHELRTPLNALVGLSQMGLDRPGSAHDQELMKRLNTHALGLLQRIHALLDFAKLDAGLLAIEPRPADVRAVVQDVVSELLPRASERALPVTFTCREPFPERIRIDSERVRQIALNLLSNAIRYTPRGSVEVMLKRTGSEDGPPAFELAVKDTGVGIPKRDQELVFTRFYRSYQTADHNSGTGLGLAMTKALVDRMGGEIRLSSRPGKGSTFRVRLPFEHLDRAMDVPVADGRRRLQRRVTVLAADDSPSNLDVVERLLAATGDRVLRATDGQAALDCFLDQPVDLVVMDVDMAPMDGIRATVEIRQRESLLDLARTPVVALTAHVVPEVRRRCMASGMDAFLTKPVDADRLAEAVESFVDRTPRVLIVDDAPTSRKVLDAALRAVGARPFLAQSVAEALSLVDAHTFDVAILDHALPDGEGPELANEMRTHGFEGSIIAISGNGAMHRSAWNVAGVHEIFEKPVGVDALWAALTRMLSPRVFDPDIADLVPEYVSDRRADLQTLQTAFQEGDAERVRRIGHQIRGSGASYGFPELTEAGEQLERCARASDWDGIASALSMIAAVLASMPSEESL